MSSKFLKNDDLSSVSGGKSSDDKFCDMTNPVAGLTKDQAESYARKNLGKDSKNMGSWKSQSALDYMKWWAFSNNESLSEEDLQKYTSDDWFEK